MFRQYVALDICVLVTVLVYSFLILCSIIDSCRLTRVRQLYSITLHPVTHHLPLHLRSSLASPFPISFLLTYLHLPYALLSTSITPHSFSAPSLHALCTHSNHLLFSLLMLLRIHLKHINCLHSHTSSNSFTFLTAHPAPSQHT